MGPLASEAQYQRVQNAIQAAKNEGVEVTSPSLPHEVTAEDSGLINGYYVAPTILSGESLRWTIATSSKFKLSLLGNL